MKHTKGPWKVRKDLTKETIICAEDKTIICGIHQKNLNKLDETEVNAELIAAAPELLEIAQNSLNIIIDHICKKCDCWSEKEGACGEPVLCDVRKTIIKLHEVIAKAKGGN